MNSTISRCVSFAAFAAIVPAAPAATATVSGHYLDDARGDAIAGQWLGAELGDSSRFAVDRALGYHTHRAYVTVGVPDDGIANDWTVHLKNVTGVPWADLFFVADLGATIGNADGTVEDAAGAAGVFTDAFHVDASGANANLLWESGVADGILSPGEEWEFAVMNFGTGVNSLPPQLTTPGMFAGSSPMAGLGGTNASILATAVPEPAAAGATAIVAVLLARRRRIRRR